MQHLSRLNYHFTRTIQRKGLATMVRFELFDAGDNLLGTLMIYEAEAVFRCADAQYSFIIKRKLWKNQWFYQGNGTFFAGYTGAKVGVSFADGAYYSVDLTDVECKELIHPLAALIYNRNGKQISCISLFGRETKLSEGDVVKGNMHTSIDNVQHLAMLLLFMQKKLEDKDRSVD